MASRIKVISKLDISEKRVPQDGRMKLVLSKSRSIDFRVSTLPTLYGEKIVLRILDAAGVKLGIEALGYEPDQQQHAARRHRAPLRDDPGDRADRQRQDGVALHLPEHPEPARHQHRDRRGSRGNPACRASTRSTSTTRRGSPSPLRCAPSCVRTRTSSWSVKSATWRPPTSRSRRRRRGTLCCRPCTRTTRRRRLMRLANMGVPAFNIASSVILITAQRLARKLCPQCKKAEDIPPEALLAGRLRRGGPRRLVAGLRSGRLRRLPAAPGTRAASASTR